MARSPQAESPYAKPDHVARVCHESCERMQLVADLLLLKEGTQGSSSSSSRISSVMEPIAAGHESYGKSCDSIVANTKALAISVKDLGQQMKLMNANNITKLADKIANQAIFLTEAAAHAAYYSSLTDLRCKPAKPGVIDRYSFERARQAIHMSYDKFKLPYFSQLTNGQVLNISKTLAENLAILTHGCTLASENKIISPMDQNQFSTCSQSLQGTTASFLTSLKLFASTRTEETRKRCLLFGKPLLAAVDTVVDFISAPQFSATPAVLTQEGRESQTDILGGAMAVISSSIQLLGATRIIVIEEDKRIITSQLQRFANCTKAIGDASKLLSSAVRQHTPMSSRRPSAAQVASYT